MQPASSLPSLFLRILENYGKIKKLEVEATNNEYKKFIQDSCSICQEAIAMINQLECFSKNESLEDLSTGSIRYLTLPAFLAYFNGQKTDRDDRLSNLKMSQTYYDEFLDMVESYGISDVPKRMTTSNCSGDGSKVVPGPVPTPRDPNALREEKIRAYKQKKALEERLGNFAVLTGPNVDEEILREESLALVRYWAYTAVEELKLISEEVEILSRFPGQRKPPSPPPKLLNRQPPLVITREQIRATVFGAGYPSVPTMTLDQFVDMQVQQGLMPAPQPQTSKPVSSSAASWRRIDPSESEEARQAAEEKAAHNDALEDADCEAALAKARRFDEFKDEHRRGSGNRANRG